MCFNSHPVVSVTSASCHRVTLSFSKLKELIIRITCGAVDFPKFYPVVYRTYVELE